MTNQSIKIERANLCCQVGMASFNWSAGKKSATSLDHWSYYMVVGTEFQMVCKIEENRTNVFGRWPPLAEGIGAYGSYGFDAMNYAVAPVLANQPLLHEEKYAN